MTIRTLLADDEPLVRTGLRTLLAAEPDFTIVAEARDGGEALDALRTQTPDLAFLDVRMPALDGFEVLDALEPAQVPAVVFVTAHDEYALRAFEVHAVDYVLKPFDAPRFHETLRRVRRRLTRTERAAPDLEPLLAALRRERGYLQRLLVKRGNRIVFVETGTVDWFEAADNYVRLHTRAGTHLIRHTIKGLEARLDPARFARTHRSAIVQIARVSSLEPTPAGDWTVCLATGDRVPLSRGYKERFQKRIGWRF